MPLTDRKISNLKAQNKIQKISDSGGLYIHVSTTGSKLWRLAYRLNGKQKLLSLGAYPVVSLKMARERREEAKRLLANGVDPSAHKQELKRLATTNTQNSFEVIACEWYLENIN